MRDVAVEPPRPWSLVVVTCIGCFVYSACGAAAQSPNSQAAATERAVRINGLMCDGEMLQYDCDDYARKVSSPCDPIPGGKTTVSIVGRRRVSATADANGRFTLSVERVGEDSEGYVDFSAENREGLRIRRIASDSCFSAGEHYLLVRLPSKSCAKRKS
jgi:hypothetical protein